MNATENIRQIRYQLMHKQGFGFDSGGGEPVSESVVIFMEPEVAFLGRLVVEGIKNVSNLLTVVESDSFSVHGVVGAVSLTV